MKIKQQKLLTILIEAQNLKRKIAHAWKQRVQQKKKEKEKNRKRNKRKRQEGIGLSKSKEYPAVEKQEQQKT